MAEVFLSLLLGVHLLAANLGSAAPLVCVWLDFRAGRGDEVAWKAGRWLAAVAIIALLVAGGLGLLAGIQLWSPIYRNAVTRLWSKVYYGILEYFFSLILMVGYLWLWRRARAAARGWRLFRSFISLLASTNLLYHFPFLMFVMARLVSDPEKSSEPITAAMFRQRMIEPEVLANSIHFLLAAVATSGMALIVFALRSRGGSDTTNGETTNRSLTAAVWGARIALVPTLLQIPVGIWVLTAQSPLMQNRLMGGSLVATSLFLGALLAGLSLMHQLASIALGDVDVRLLRKSAALFVAVVLFMTATLRYGNQPPGLAGSFSSPVFAAQNENPKSESVKGKADMSVRSVTLVDEATGSEAKILTGFGFNCYQFRVTSRGEPVDVLYSAVNFESGKERPSGSGIPLLFPFPGRIAHAKLQWEGKEYALPLRDAKGNAIHGFVHERPWRVLEQTANRVTGQFQASVDDPAILPLWPADFRITAIYELAGATLKSRYVIDNPDSKPLPCGFGTHPYFKLPLGSTGTKDDCQAKLPVSAEWELNELLPTGRRIDLPNATTLQAGQRYGDMKYDTVFTGLRFDGDWCVATIHDPNAKRTLTIRFDRAFRECVVFTPLLRQALCIEPYTCVPNAADLQARGIDSGLRVLKPGESFTANVEVRLE